MKRLLALCLAAVLTFMLIYTRWRGVSVDFTPAGQGPELSLDSVYTLVAPMSYTAKGGLRCLSTPMIHREGKPRDIDRDDGGKALFKFRIDDPGEYTVFARAFWQDGQSNSFYLRMDSLPYEKFGNDGAESTWIWIKSASAFALDTGEHMLTLREREWGAAVSALFVLRVPAYAQAGLGFHRAAALADTQRFRDGDFYTDTTRLFLYPEYQISPDTPAVFRFFFADTFPWGVFTSDRRPRLKIKDPAGRTVYSGRFTASHEAEVTIARLREGEYTVEVDGRTVRWTRFHQRLKQVERALEKARAAAKDTDRQALWLPTLELYHKNILRGFRIAHLSDLNLPNSDYVDAQFVRAERLIEAFEAADFRDVVMPGSNELAAVSDQDGKLSLFVLSLPLAYFEETGKFPLVVFLHGSSGTQWSLERARESEPAGMPALTVPVLSPAARHDWAWQKGDEADALQIIRTVCAHFRLDPARMALTGFSMGGIGAWRLADHHPRMFRVIMPMAGAFPWELDGGPPRPGRPLPEALNARIIIVHSPDDRTVEYKYALSIQKQLEEHGIPFKLVTHDLGHELPADWTERINGLFGKP
jgi:dienelactone hydrolase